MEVKSSFALSGERASNNIAFVFVSMLASFIKSINGSKIASFSAVAILRPLGSLKRAYARGLVPSCCIILFF